MGARRGIRAGMLTFLFQLIVHGRNLLLDYRSGDEKIKPMHQYTKTCTIRGPCALHIVFLFPRSPPSPEPLLDLPTGNFDQECIDKFDQNQVHSAFLALFPHRVPRAYEALGGYER